MQDIIPPQRLKSHAHHYHGRPDRSVVYMRHARLVKPAASPVVVEIDEILLQPTPMVKPVESLSPFEKVAAFESALLRARYELRAEGRPFRHLKLRALR